MEELDSKIYGINSEIAEIKACYENDKKEQPGGVRQESDKIAKKL